MNRLMLYLYILVMPVLSGSFIIGVLVNPDFQASWLVTAAVAGAVLAIPVSWYVGREISKSGKRN